jgi:two-component system cell cycle sensor histidine kinase/response regulator CckA
VLLSPVTRKVSMKGEAVLAEVLDTVATFVRYSVAPEVTFQVTHSDALARVVGDRGALEQVLLNLVRNALDAMPDGGQLSILTFRGPPDGLVAKEEAERLREHWTIAVSDTGTGMSEEIRARIFEPYFTTKADRGTGLGLPTSAALVEAAGGLMRVHSTPGGGTTMYATLPPASSLRDGRRMRTIDVARQLGALQVLVASPDSSFRARVASALRRRGAIIVGSLEVPPSPSEAIAATSTALLIVSDLMRVERWTGLLRDWLQVTSRRAIVIARDPGALEGGQDAAGRMKGLCPDAGVAEIIDAISELCA